MATIDEARDFLEERASTLAARYGPAAPQIIVPWELEELTKDGAISERDADILRGELDELINVPFS